MMAPSAFAISFAIWRAFSRLDEAELKEASIQDGIESTLKILSQYYGRDKNSG